MIRYEQNHSVAISEMDHGSSAEPRIHREYRRHLTRQFGEKSPQNFSMVNSPSASFSHSGLYAVVEFSSEKQENTLLIFCPKISRLTKHGIGPDINISNNRVWKSEDFNRAQKTNTSQQSPTSTKRTGTIRGGLCSSIREKVSTINGKIVHAIELAENLHQKHVQQSWKSLQFTVYYRSSNSRRSHNSPINLNGSLILLTAATGTQLKTLTQNLNRMAGYPSHHLSLSWRSTCTRNYIHIPGR
jgi:hypothetical protein